MSIRIDLKLNSPSLNKFIHAFFFDGKKNYRCDIKYWKLCWTLENAIGIRNLRESYSLSQLRYFSAMKLIPNWKISTQSIFHSEWEIVCSLLWHFSWIVCDNLLYGCMPFVVRNSFAKSKYLFIFMFRTIYADNSTHAWNILCRNIERVTPQTEQQSTNKKFP